MSEPRDRLAAELAASIAGADDDEEAFEAVALVLHGYGWLCFDIQAKPDERGFAATAETIRHDDGTRTIAITLSADHPDTLGEIEIQEGWEPMSVEEPEKEQ